MPISLLLSALVLTVASIWAFALPFMPRLKGRRAMVAAAAPLCLLICLAAVAAFELHRDISDRRVYLALLGAVRTEGLQEGFRQSGSEDPLFVAFVYIIASLGGSEFLLYFSTSLLSSVLYVTGLVRLMDWRFVPLAFLFTLSIGLYIDYTSIAIRQGLALATLFLGVSLLFTGNRRIGAAIVIVAPLLHWSAAPFALLAVALAVLSIGTRALLVVWSLLAVFYGLGITARLIAPIGGYVPALDTYSNTALASSYTGGTERLDFLVVSGAVALAAAFLSKLDDLPSWYSRYSALYLAFNCVFLLFGSIYYSDRLASYSWYLAPLLFLGPAAMPSSRHRVLFAAGGALATLAVGFAAGTFEELARGVAGL